MKDILQKGKARFAATHAKHKRFLIPLLCGVLAVTLFVTLILTGAIGGNNGTTLAELKEAAYALGCNAVVGVDFDYITLEPETANFNGGTLYEPYIICVTANGNAVVIEKEEP